MSICRIGMVIAFSVAHLPCVVAQGTLVFDQQSASHEDPISGNVLLQNGTVGQSFAPSFAGIDFVRLMVGDWLEGNGEGATMSVALREGSVNGPILSKTDPLLLEDGFVGVAHFTFPGTVGLTPGAVYLLEPSLAEGSDLFGVHSWAYGYDGGVGYWNGVPNPASDLWFREGVVLVPEPVPWLSFLLGVPLLMAFRGRYGYQPNNKGYSGGEGRDSD